MIAFRTYRKRQRIRDRKTGTVGKIAAVNENCIVVWLDNGRTLNLESFDADMRLEILPS